MPIFISNIITFAAGLILGVIAGWLLRGKYVEKKMANSERTIIAMVVLAIWVISTLVDIATVEYTTPFAIHGIFGAIVGFFYETSIKDMFNKK